MYILQEFDADGWFGSSESGEVFGRFKKAGPFAITLMAVDAAGQQDASFASNAKRDLNSWFLDELGC